MKLTRLFEDDDAVSPVIGVILMVAITVILAAVIGTFVLGLGNQVQSTTPSAQFAVDFNDDVSGGTSTWDNLTVTHDGGDKIPNSQLNLSSDVTFTYQKQGSLRVGASPGGPVTYNETMTFTAMGAPKQMTAGDSVVATAKTSENNFNTATFRVVWTSESGDNSATLRKWTGPDA